MNRCRLCNEPINTLGHPPHMMAPYPADNTVCCACGVSTPSSKMRDRRRGSMPTKEEFVASMRAAGKTEGYIRACVRMLYLPPMGPREDGRWP